MESITVKQFKEMLAVADDCARVVIKNKESSFNLFDIECVSPIGEFSIIIPESDKVQELESDIKGLDKKLVEVLDKADEIERLANDIKDIVK